MRSSLDRSKEAVNEGIRNMTLDRYVLNIRTNAENVGCLLLDANRDLIAITDREGYLSIYDYGKPSNPEISKFMLADHRENAVIDSVDTVALFSLDLSHSLDRLMACSTDGCVRVWRNCTESDPQLLSAWHAVPVATPPSFVLAPACFDWQPTMGHIFSAGLSLPGIVQQMDLECASIVQQVTAVCSLPLCRT